MKLGQASRVISVPSGFFGGFVGTLFGTGGPFYVIYLNLRHLDKSAFRYIRRPVFDRWRNASYRLRSEGFLHAGNVELHGFSRACCRAGFVFWRQDTLCAGPGYVRQVD